MYEIKSLSKITLSYLDDRVSLLLGRQSRCDATLLFLGRRATRGDGGGGGGGGGGAGGGGGGGGGGGLGW